MLYGSDYKEEQDDELEALKAIYTDEEFKGFKIISFKFDINVSPLHQNYPHRHGVLRSQ